MIFFAFTFFLLPFQLCRNLIKPHWFNTLQCRKTGSNQNPIIFDRPINLPWRCFYSSTTIAFYFIPELFCRLKKRALHTSWFLFLVSVFFFWRAKHTKAEKTQFHARLLRNLEPPTGGWGVASMRVKPDARSNAEVSFSKMKTSPRPPKKMLTHKLIFS